MGNWIVPVNCSTLALYTSPFSIQFHVAVVIFRHFSPPPKNAFFRRLDCVAMLSLTHSHCLILSFYFSWQLQRTFWHIEDSENLRERRVSSQFNDSKSVIQGRAQRVRNSQGQRTFLFCLPLFLLLLLPPLSLASGNSLHLCFLVVFISDFYKFRYISPCVFWLCLVIALFISVVSSFSSFAFIFV